MVINGIYYESFSHWGMFPVPLPFRVMPEPTAEMQPVIKAYRKADPVPWRTGERG